MELVVVVVVLIWLGVSAVVAGLCVAAARGDGDGLPGEGLLATGADQASHAVAAAVVERTAAPVP